MIGINKHEQDKHENSGSSILRAYLSGLLATTVLVLVLSLICCVVIHFSTVFDEHLTVLQIAISIIALFCGGFITGKQAKAKGLYRGAILGFLYVILLFILSISQGIEINTGETVIKAFCYIIAAVGGGLLGINKIK